MLRNADRIKRLGFYCLQKQILVTGCILFSLVLLSSPILAVSQEDDSAKSDLADLLAKTPAELADISVVFYTASKKEENLWETPAAAYVISATNIRRSTVNSIPDLLRMVPGLFVGSVDASTWVVGSRGFGKEYTFKLLVMIDGRSVYNPEWGGVYWNIQDYPLEDIERIEIIRGPGGTLWGTNAGNGVINIVTKHAKDTQGGLISGTVGTNEFGGNVRYGGKLGEEAYYRVYGKYKDVNDFNDVLGNDDIGDWSLEKTGFRIDWEPSSEDHFTFQGDAFQDNVLFSWELPGLEPPFIPTQTIGLIKDKKGADILFRWNKEFEDLSDMTLQVYYDYFELDNDFISYFKYHILDLDYQYSFTYFSSHDTIIGLRYRLTADDIQNKFLEFIPDHKNFQTFSTFIHDTYTIVDDRLKLTLGSQFEHNDYTGFEYQPNAKLIYTPNEKYTTWISISRAVETFNRVVNDSSWPVGGSQMPFDSTMIPLIIDFIEKGTADSGNVISFEIGQRIQATSRLSFDLSAFYNRLDDQLTLEVLWDDPLFLSAPIPHFMVSGEAGNKMDGEIYGAELSAIAQITDSWKVFSSYSALDIQLHPDPDSTDIMFKYFEEKSPHHQFKLQSYIDLPWDLELDTSFSFIDNISGWNIPSYGRLDVRLGWKPNKNLEASIVAYNLLDDQHPEARGDYTINTEPERGVFAKLTYRF